MTRGGGRARSTRGRGRGVLEPIVSLPPTTVSPPVQLPVSIGSPADLPIPSPSNSNAPPTCCDLTIIHVEDERNFTSGMSLLKLKFAKFFLAQAGLRYADMLSKFKTKRTSTGRPACVAEETWAIREAYWDRPDVKAKSEQQRKNRMSEVERPVNSVNSQHWFVMPLYSVSNSDRDELQKESNLFECFEQMHKKHDDMFVDERSKRIAEEIQARHDAATQEAEGSTESPNIDMSQLYMDVVGGVKKQRIYGLGTKSSSFITRTSCGSSATSQLHQDTMKEMVNQQLETMRAEMEAKLQAERDPITVALFTVQPSVFKSENHF
nr:uncharacterized protein LOC109149905 [Ipomoea batatas]